MPRAFLVGNLVAVALGMVLGVYPVYLAIIVSVLAAIGVEKLRVDYKDYAELSLAVILSSALGLMTVLVSLSRSNSSIFSYLFGSISLVTPEDLWVIFPISIFIVGGVLVFYYGFFYLSFNEEEAHMAGIPVKLLNNFFMVGCYYYLLFNANCWWIVSGVNAYFASCYSIKDC